MLGFENVAEWSTSAGTLGTSTNVIQGSHSLSISGIGIAEVRSVAIGTPATVGTTASFDLLLPNQQPNPSWFGTVQVLLDVPSQGINGVFLGQIELTGLPKNTFQHLTFAIPANVAVLLRHTYSDLKVRIALNVPVGTGTYLLDNFSFGSGSGGSGGSGGAGGVGGSISAAGSSVAGNGGVNSGGSGGAVGPAGVATAVGSFNGASVPLVNAVSIRRSGGSNQVTVLLSDTIKSCGAMQAGHAKGNNWFLALTVFTVRTDASSAPTPLAVGTYVVEDNGTAAAKRYVVAQLSHEDPSCNNLLRDSDATSGSITFTRLDSTRVDGSYSLVFPNGNGTLSGTFAAPNCAMPAPTSNVKPSTPPSCEP